jgi:hypothetical protein
MIQERQILCKRGEIHYHLRTRYLVTVFVSRAPGFTPCILVESMLLIFLVLCVCVCVCLSLFYVLGGELRCSEKVSSSCSTCGSGCVTLVTNLIISHEWGKVDLITITTNIRENRRGKQEWTIQRHIHSGSQMLMDLSPFTQNLSFLYHRQDFY